MSVTVKLNVPGISCHHCTMTIQRETQDIAGVEKVDADVESKTATYVLRDERVLPEVKKTLAEIGYPAAD